MKYFYVEPEVAGGLGPNTLMDRSAHPPIVKHLHYQFDGWLGDALVESFPVFVLTEEGAKKLQEAGATGIQFADAETTASTQFLEMHPGRKLPRFIWLQIVGKPGGDDFGIAAGGRLVVSERALNVLGSTQMSHALIEPFVK